MAPDETQETRFPPPFAGTTCTRRNHVVSKNEEGTERLTIDPGDRRLFACDCGSVMIGNGFVEIRFGILPHRFPEASDVV